MPKGEIDGIIFINGKGATWAPTRQRRQNYSEEATKKQICDGKGVSKRKQVAKEGKGAWINKIWDEKKD